MDAGKSIEGGQRGGPDGEPFKQPRLCTLVLV